MKFIQETLVRIAENVQKMTVENLPAIFFYFMHFVKKNLAGFVFFRNSSKVALMMLFRDVFEISLLIPQGISSITK